MHVSYGPPGHKGVTQIMGLGYTELDALDVPSLPVVREIDKAHRTVGLIALATWAGGFVMGSNTAKNIGIGGLLAVVYVQMLKPKAKKATVAAPTSVQGWG